jgi:hypothetical protein
MRKQIELRVVLTNLILLLLVGMTPNTANAAPVPVISSSEPDPTNNSPFTITIDFGATVDASIFDNLNYTNCTKSNPTSVSGDDSVWELDISPTADGAVTVQVPADLYQDGIAEWNLQSNLFSITYDTQGPQPSITSGASDPTNQSPITVTIDFGAPVTVAVFNNLTYINCNRSNKQSVSPDDSVWTVDLAPIADGSFGVQVPAATYQDAATNDNEASAPFSITYDTRGSVPVISSSEPDPTNNSPFTITIDFGATVGSSVFPQLTYTNCTWGDEQSASPDDSVWTLDITPLADGIVIVQVPVDIYQDAATNWNLASNLFSITYDSKLSIPEIWVDDDYTEYGFNDGHTWGYDAFDNIQDGIDAEILATLVRVAAGIYYENITMVSGVSVIGAGPDISIIDGNSNGSVVTAIDVNSTAKLAGFTIMNGSATHGGGMYCYNSSPLVSNCLFTGNSGDYGGGIYNEYECSLSLKNCTFAGNTAVNGNAIACDSSGQSNPSTLEIRDSIIWDDINGIWNNDGSTITINYSDVQGGWSGVGNLDIDPNFADPCTSNYHLMSQAGRWYNQTQYLVYDEVTSPCIDAGDPSSSIGFEITPNGALVNMGSFGGTWQASRSYFNSTPCPEPVIGDINGDCKINFVDFAFIADHWLEDNSH